MKYLFRRTVIPFTFEIFVGGLTTAVTPSKSSTVTRNCYRAGKASLGCVVDLALLSVQEVSTYRNYVLHGELSSSAEYMPKNLCLH